MNIICDQWESCGSYEEYLEIVESTFAKFIVQLLHSGNPTAIRTFQTDFLVPFDDVRFHLFKWLGSKVETGSIASSSTKNEKAVPSRKRAKTNSGAAQSSLDIDFSSAIVQNRLFELLHELPMPGPGHRFQIQCEGLKKWAKETETKVKSLQQRRNRSARLGPRAIFDVESHKEMFTRMWLGVLALPLTSELKLLVLKDMAEHIAPHVDTPYALWDYLFNAFDIGGVFAVHALHGLFVLMTKHNLDFPAFYDKLYSIFKPDILHARYRQRFLDVLGLVMTSTRLPASLVASFIKRASRLCLYAPTPMTMYLLSLIYNLLKSHPETTVLIHRLRRTDITDSTDPADKAKLEALYAGTDPFDANEDDPSKTNALFSSCWELKLLMDHWSPRISFMARSFRNEMKTQRKASEHSNQTFFKMFLGELQHHAGLMKKGETPAVTYERKDGLFDVVGDATMAWNTIWEF